MMSQEEKNNYISKNTKLTNLMEKHAQEVTHNKGQGLINKAMLLQLPH